MREALESLGLRCRLPLTLKTLAGESDEELRARSRIAVTFTDPSDPLREVDVLVDVPIPARELVGRAQRLESKDLIRLKRAARPQDLADVAHLERLASRGRA